MKACCPPTGVRSISSTAPSAGNRGLIRAAHVRLGLASLLLLAVLLIGWIQGEGWLAAADQRGMESLTALRSSAVSGVLTPLMRLATGAGDSATRVIVAVLGGIFLYVRRRGRAALWLTGAVAGIALLNWTLKQLFARARPELVEHLVNVHSYSFPSGHSANGLVICFAFAMLGGRRWAYAVAGGVALSIGLSRIYLGVHWPSDVVAGWTTGTAWMLFWSVAGARLLASGPAR
jgi:membrane-associated phospholipid phosphatase